MWLSYYWDIFENICLWFWYNNIGTACLMGGCLLSTFNHILSFFRRV